MDILLINQAFYPDQSATSRYLTDLAKALTKNGHAVHVLTSTQGYLNTDERFSAEEEWQGISITRVPPLYNTRSGRFRRTLSALGMNLRFALRLVRMPRSDVTVVLTSPPLIAWIAAFLAKKPRRGLLYWVMDLNPDQAFEAGWIKPGSIVGKLLSAALRGTFQKSRAIAVLDNYMAERAVKSGAPGERVQVLPLWSDPGLHPIAPDENDFRKELNLSDKFVVMYSGNFSICHPLETMLIAAREMQDEKDIAFRFIGGGARVNEVLRFISEHSLRNTRYFPYEKAENLSQSLSAAELHIVSFGTPYIGILHPSKIYGILAVERPVVLIGSENTFIYEECVKKGMGYRIDHGDVAGLVEIIRRERAAGEDRVRRELIRKAAAEYTVEKRVAKYVELIEGM